MRMVLAAVVVPALIAACSASENRDLSGTLPAKLSAAASPPPSGGAATAAAASAATPSAPPLPNRDPVAGAVISSPRQVLTAGPFVAEAPTIRANTRHSFVVTGKDCMTCHGTGGSAPHFAYGGSISLGKSWVWGTPPWSTNPAASSSASAGNDGSYDDGSYDDGSYDDGSYGGGGSCDDGSYGGSGGYDDGSYDDGSYDDGSYDDGSYDDGSYDDGSYGGGGCGPRRQGWPQDRTNPSPGTGVRIIGADGYVFDTVTDLDGNFWFKSAADVKVPAYTGIKYGSFTVTGDTNGIACASCHENGAPDSPGRLWTWDGPTPK